MQTKIMALALATALLSTTAWAQTNQPAPSSPPANTAASAQSGQFLTQEKPGEWRASKLKGLDVYNSNNEKIGDIREMLWGGRWRDGTIVAGSNADGASHGTAARRFEPVPHAPGGPSRPWSKTARSLRSSR
jgi:hypothetical protein